MTSWCVRSIPPCLLWSLSSRSSCWQSPSASPRTSGRTSAGWHPSGNEGSPCLCLNPFMRKHFIHQSWEVEPSFFQSFVYRGWHTCSCFPYLYRRPTATLALRWDTVCVLAHTCAFVPVPLSLPCTVPKGQTSRKSSHLRVSCTWSHSLPLWTLLLPGSYQRGRLPIHRLALCLLTVTDMIHFPWRDKPFSLCPPHSWRFSETWSSSYTRLTNSVSLWGTQTTVSIALWPFPFL